MPPKPGASAATAATIWSTSFVARQIGQASTPPNSLKSAALPSITGIAASGPMSPSPSTAVPSLTTATEFRFTVRFQAASRSSAIAVQIRATPGRVRHREVVARADRRLAPHLELAAEVEEERAVGDVLDLDAVDGADGGHDPLEVVGVGRLDGDVAHLRAAVGADEVDRAERAAGVADRLRDAGERAGIVREADPDRGAERG